VGAHTAAAQMTKQELCLFFRASHPAIQRDSLDTGPTPRAERAPFFNGMLKTDLIVLDLFFVALGWLALLPTLLRKRLPNTKSFRLMAFAGDETQFRLTLCVSNIFLQNRPSRGIYGREVVQTWCLRSALPLLRCPCAS
jgi:hypothetical protein